MSLIKFTLKDEHVALLKAMNWGSMNNFIISADNPNEDKSPFGGDDLYEDMDLILNGKPDNFETVINSDIGYVVTEEKKEIFDKLLSELPLALEVILRTHNFDLGNYTAKYHQRFSWKKK